MFSFFRKKAPNAPESSPAVATDAEPVGSPDAEPAKRDAVVAPAATGSSMPAAEVGESERAARAGWMSRLRQGLRKTGVSIAQVFTGTRIDDALYDELQDALLMADTGAQATEFLLADLRRRVKGAKATEPSAVRGLLADAIAELLAPLERPLVVGESMPTVIMVVGVNGAGKTTTIGKITRHLAGGGCKVLLAAADTFRAAAREQLAVWADRNRVEIVSQQGGDPSAVTFDAVVAGKARGCDVVIADTAGRLPTQLHLMEELRKIRRVIGKAQPDAPHEVLLVIDGNTGQNALAQVRAFDDALQLSGLVVTKLDGTAKGGVLAAIALWSRERAAADASRRAVAVYFIGVGEKLEDLQPFSAREFAEALLAA
jgi:fused signal recognition particle receptor